MRNPPPPKLDGFTGNTERHTRQHRKRHRHSRRSSARRGQTPCLRPEDQRGVRSLPISAADLLAPAQPRVPHGAGITRRGGTWNSERRARRNPTAGVRGPTGIYCPGTPVWILGAGGSEGRREPARPGAACQTKGLRERNQRVRRVQGEGRAPFRATQIVASPGCPMWGPAGGEQDQSGLGRR